MAKIDPTHSLGTLAIHAGDVDNPYHAHATPIYETSTFSFPDVETGQAIWRGEKEGHIYTRLTNPNFDELIEKITVLEAIDLIRDNPEKGSERDRWRLGVLLGDGCGHHRDLIQIEQRRYHHRPGSALRSDIHLPADHRAALRHQRGLAEGPHP